MEKKKLYQAPSVRKVRLDIKASVLGGCQTSPELLIFPTCVTQTVPCPSIPAS
jgi:hypothetical protein